VNEVMNTIRAFAAEDAHIIFGAVFDEAMEDNLRVTVVATGLGSEGRSAAKPVISVVSRTGTDDPRPEPFVNYQEIDQVPAVVRRNRASATIEAMSANGVGTYDIPAFLRKQAD